MKNQITEYIKNKAANLGVYVKPSKSKGKKIDVFSLDGKKLASIGAIGYYDYPTYLSLERAGKVPAGTARKRRNLYKKRHINNRLKRGTPGWYADKLLW